jgi:hypothetical protein
MLQMNTTTTTDSKIIDQSLTTSLQHCIAGKQRLLKAFFREFRQHFRLDQLELLQNDVQIGERGELVSNLPVPAGRTERAAAKRRDRDHVDDLVAHQALIRRHVDRVALRLENFQNWRLNLRRTNISTSLSLSNHTLVQHTNKQSGLRDVA